ncbi:PDZ and LIM domain protein Zasp-like isoform X2 [Atheta coriaria]|uniref:PDZ and LIM domain protein Zasp-like isoform X2 n=1 Tax=Dalotia coriaria TaxID=877792 RepID=UPI0031F38A83
MASMMTVNLNRGDAPNLGFRLQGGVDFAQPLLIQKVNNGSPADRAGLLAGDSVIKINNTDVFNLRHKDAQDVIIRAGPAFAITIQRGGSTWRPSVTPTGALNQGSINNISPVTKTSLAAQPQQSIDAIGTGHNTSAKPFLNGTSNGGPKLVNKQYNSPIGLYSDQSIAESITAQSEILSTGAVGVNFKKNEKNYDASKSAVFSMLQEAEREPRESEAVNRSDFYSRQSRHPMPNANRQNYYQNNYQYEPEITRCTDCERVIVGVFVRIKDKNLHVECFKCSTCGASLKNVGYYNINNKLYCDIHAKLAAKSNAPGPNLVPVTIPPGGKAPASAISAALSSHSLPSPGPVSPKLGGPISPSQNLTAAPFQSDNVLNSSKLLKEIIQAAAKKNDASLNNNNNNNHEHEDKRSDSDLVSSVDDLSLSDYSTNIPSKFKTFDDLSVEDKDSVDGLIPSVKTINKIPAPKFPSYYNNKQNYTTAPRPFSSVAAPLSPNNYSRPLPKTPTQAPPQPTFAPPQQTYAPPPAPVTPEHDTHETEIVYSNDRVEITTTMPPGSEKYYNEINVSIPMPTFAPSLSSESSPRSFISCNSNPPSEKNDYFTSSKNNYIETTFPAGAAGSDKPMTLHRANKSQINDNNANTICNVCQKVIRGPFITALGKIWCPEHFTCATASCRRPLQDIGFVEDGGQLHCEYCFEQYLAPNCAKCGSKIKGDCLKAIQKNFHPECFNCAHCGKLFGNSPFFLEDGLPYCETDWNEMFTTKCFACGFPVEAGDRWVEALSNNYHSQCFNCTMCKKNLEGQSFYAKGGRPFCKNHAR